MTSESKNSNSKILMYKILTPSNFRDIIYNLVFLSKHPIVICKFNERMAHK